jgi:hypothetical protein
VIKVSKVTHHRVLRDPQELKIRVLKVLLDLHHKVVRVLRVTRE